MSMASWTELRNSKPHTQTRTKYLSLVRGASCPFSKADFEINESRYDRIYGSIISPAYGSKQNLPGLEASWKGTGGVGRRSCKEWTCNNRKTIRIDSMLIFLSLLLETNPLSSHNIGRYARMMQVTFTISYHIKLNVKYTSEVNNANLLLSQAWKRKKSVCLLKNHWCNARLKEYVTWSRWGDGGELETCSA